MLKPKPRLNRSLVQPYPMEDRAIYISRFAAHTEMSDLFPDQVQRRQMASEIFAQRWEDALVRVTYLDGVQVFID